MTTARSVTPLGLALAVALACVLSFGLLWSPTALAQSGDGSGGEAGSNAGSSATAQTDRSTNMIVLRTDSTLYAVTHRAGLFGFLGHEHAITTQEWSARLCYLEENVDQSFIEVTIPTGSVRIDTERGQELAGLESSPDPGTIEDLQMEMLGDRYLDADAFPELAFTSTSVTHAEGTADDSSGADAPPADLEVTGDLTIHGQTNSVTFPVVVERTDTGSFRFEAHVAFRMTNFGIAPENTAGVVAVADEMDIYLNLAAQRTRETCD